MLDFKEIYKLSTILDILDIKHELHPFKDGMQIIFDEKRDVCIHSFTYGCEEGLMESYGFPEDNGDVTGYMTARDVLKRLL